MGRTIYLELVPTSRIAADLSAGGVFVQDKTLAMLDTCTIIVFNDSGQLELPAKAVYVDGNGGVGLELVGFDPVLRAKIVALSEAAVGTPSEPAEPVAADVDAEAEALLAGMVDVAEPAEPPRPAGHDGLELAAPDVHGARDPGALDLDALDLDALDLDARAPDARDLGAHDPNALDFGALDLGDADALELATESGDAATDRANGDHASGETASEIASYAANVDAMTSDSDDPADAARRAADAPPPELSAGTDEERAEYKSLHVRLRGLSLVDQIKRAKEGDPTERMLLERMYGKNVWEALLRNPRLTAPEVARIARMGSLPRPQLEVIVGNGGWLQVPEVRRALLSNPRLGTDQILRVLRLMSKHELKLASVQTVYTFAVRDAAKRMIKESAK